MGNDEFERGGVYRLFDSRGNGNYFNLVGVREECSEKGASFATFLSFIDDEFSYLNLLDFSAYKNLIPMGSLEIQSGDLVEISGIEFNRIFCDKEGVEGSWLKECEYILREMGCEDGRSALQGNIMWKKGNILYEIFGNGSVNSL